MADPFGALRLSPVPTSPDPSFSARLRSRLARALDLPKGVIVSTSTIDQELATSSPEEASPNTTVVPYLAVSGAEGALAWYTEALGASVRGRPIVMPDGRIGHAELDVGGARFMLSDEHPAIGVSAPAPGSGASVTLVLTVAQVDSLIERAVAAGAHLERPAADFDYGRNGVIRDPFGHRWMIASEATPTAAIRAAGLRHGDVGYVSLFVPDVERAAAFFSAVLGWQYDPGSGPEGRQVQGLSLHHGLWGGVEHATLFLCFAVDDITAAVQLVRAAGGTAEEPHSEPYGLLSGCLDDDGVRFAIFEPPGGTVAEPARPVALEGDVAYVTMETRDSAKARAFYGTLLRWRFSPGRVTDAWQVSDVVPMLGVSSGHDRATGVPMYRVDDVAAAVQRVRQAGGSATDPEAQPYGITSTCSDDQGTRFYLGQV
jgi:uncharacterized glyoxalase superfamily protein PhnB